MVQENEKGVVGAITNTFSKAENNVVDSLWQLDAAHHECIKSETIINKCSAAISGACLLAKDLDPGYVCPISALQFNLDRFARACHIPKPYLVDQNGTVIDLIPNGQPDPTIRASFECVCDECLSDAYPGCKWIRGTLSYSECRGQLDCYADNAELNTWTTLFNGELDCWNAYYYVGIAATVLLVLLVFYGWFSTRIPAKVTVKQNVNVTAGGS